MIEHTLRVAWRRHMAGRTVRGRFLGRFQAVVDGREASRGTRKMALVPVVVVLLYF